jgi:hypothetical protein
MSLRLLRVNFEEQVQPTADMGGWGQSLWDFVCQAGKEGHMVIGKVTGPNESLSRESQFLFNYDSKHVR